MKTKKIIDLLCRLGILLAASLMASTARGDRPALTLTVEVEERLAVDSLFVRFRHTTLPQATPEADMLCLKRSGPRTFVYAGRFPQARGQFSLHIRPAAGSIWEDRYAYLPLTPAFYWEAGDSLTLLIQKRQAGKPIGSPMYDYAYTFRGKGAAKYNAWLRVYRTYLQAPTARPAERLTLDYQEMASWSQIRAALDTLQSQRAALDDFHYDLFRADLVGGQSERFARLKSLGETSRDSGWCRDVLARQLMSPLDSLAGAIPGPVAYHSRALIHYQFERLRFEAHLAALGGDPFDLLEAVATRYEGGFRDRLWLNLFLQNTEGRDLVRDYQRVRGQMTDAACQQALREVVVRLPGMPVLDFELPDLAGNRVRLADLRGKVVFLDAWFTGCGACAAYYRQVLKPAKEALKAETDIVFVSLSVDRSEALWRKSVASGTYTSARAVNLYTEGQGLDHTWTRQYRWEGVPKLMVVTREGKIHQLYENGLAEDIRTAEALVRSLQAVKSER
ncbi:hypothetical protein GCM10027275_10590 [Rhabdobacter roseus]|uniref:Thiol-disulfide isomerase/thioredoxin n=1 Tax=Rhabdobacter roseus TaxID=1655419 RepID=A0A840TSL1_9BACT|nr:TlpA disulfide reductase family protein [Rhabdobacter roseus]MBB5282968.1 thiol-disulfide isomerase/thioredoxin [Rhabdobacter roseus]